MPALSSKTLEYIIRAKDETAKAVQSARGRFESLSGTFLGVGAAMTVVSVLGVTAIKKLATEASKLQQLEIGFTTMLGSAEAAQEKIEELADFAARTPFTIEGVENAARSLLAVGFEAEDIIPTLKAVGDVSAGLGRGEEGLRRLILNLGQVKTQGKLTGRELRDFAVLGVPLIQELADTMGVSKQEIAELTSAGKITNDIVVQAFKNMTEEGGRFANLMAKQNKTLLGQWSNMQDSLTLLARNLGEPLIEPLTKVIEKVIKFTEAVGKFVENNPEVAKFASIFGLIITTIALFAAPILIVLGTLALLGIALAPAGALAFAIIAITALITAIILKWDDLSVALANAAQILRENVAAAFDFMLEKARSVIKALQDAFNLVRQITGQNLAQDIGRGLRNLFDGESGDTSSPATSSSSSNTTNNQSVSITAPIIGSVTVNNEADEDRLVEKIDQTLTRVLQLNTLGAT